MIGVLLSENAKLGFMPATYRGMHTPTGSTCPATCPLRDSGCYARSSFTAGTAKRAALSSHEDGKKVQEFVRTLPIGSKIRFHVSGDFFKADGKRLDKRYINGLKRAVSKRPDLQAWAYTHAKNGELKRLRSTFKNTSLTLNASCDTITEAIANVKQNIKSVVTVGAKFDTQNIDGVKFVVCPAQTSDRQCKDCMLCAKSQRSCVVAFRGHGIGAKSIQTLL